MLELPTYIYVTFIATVLVTLTMFVYVLIRSDQGTDGALRIMWLCLAWLLMQAIMSLQGFYYRDTQAFLLPLPPVLAIIALFVSRQGRSFIESIPIVSLTYLSVVRIPVELCLYWLSVHKYVPELMTFAGRNFDIISGITAPIVAYTWHKGMLNRNMFLLWHIAALLSLVNIVGNAVLSAPFAFQRFGFDQPNVAVLYFPFIWLPCFIVPVVLFSHLVSIRRLTR